MREGRPTTPRRPSGRSCASRRSVTRDRPRRPTRRLRPHRRDAARWQVRVAQADPPQPFPVRRAGRGGALERARCAGNRRLAATGAEKSGRRRGGRGRSKSGEHTSTHIDASVLAERRGRERNGRPIGRYQMCVQVREGMAQVAVLEGRNLIEHYVSRPADDVSQIHGNIYVGRIQNVLPGMEAAFVDIATPEERGALPRRRPVRRRGHRGEGPTDRGHPAGPAAHRLPGHEEPDRGEGRPPHPGGVAARSLRRADPELEDLRDLQAPARRRAQAPAVDPRPGEAGRARPHRAHRRRARHRGGAPRRHAPAAPAVGADRRQGGQGQGADVALPRARARRAGDPRGVQRRVPPGGHRRPPAATTT